MHPSTRLAFAVVAGSLAACGAVASEIASGDAGEDGRALPKADSSTVADAAADSAPRDAYDASPPNVVFVTSQAYTGDLGGSSGADQKCQAHAADAGLDGTFIAYLATTIESARARLDGGRGWVRTDGKPVADLATDLASGYLWYPIALDEHGKPAAVTPLVGTGADDTGNTQRSGDASFTCDDWTTGNASLWVVTGDLLAGYPAFEDSFSEGCDAPMHLYCLTVDRAVPVVRPNAVGRYAFVAMPAFDTSQGLAAADAICQNAAAGFLPGSYKALLATSSTSAASRFDLSGAPWLRPDGVLVVASAADLASDKLLAPVILGADGGHLGGGGFWSGAASMGSAGDGGTSCNDWTSADGSSSALAGQVGTIASTLFGPSFGDDIFPCGHWANVGLLCFQE
jgi:hypothetical protein